MVDDLSDLFPIMIEIGGRFVGRANGSNMLFLPMNRIRNFYFFDLLEGFAFVQRNRKRKDSIST